MRAGGLATAAENRGGGDDFKGAVTLARRGCCEIVGVNGEVLCMYRDGLTALEMAGKLFDNVTVRAGEVVNAILCVCREGLEIALQMTG